MKLRNGFVSNSSSSSFLVKHITRDWDKTPPLSKEDIILLEDYGFYKTYAFYPDQVTNESELIKDTDPYNYGLDVICNEDEPLIWLVKNNIPFTADCHYGQFTLVYEKDSDHIVSLRNNGHFYLMTYTKDLVDYNKGMVKIPKEEFIKGGGYFF